MKKIFLCFIIVFFLFISEIKAANFDLSLFVCDTELCEGGTIPDNDDKFMIPSGRKLYVNISWDTLFNNDLDLSYIDITYSFSSGINRTTNFINSNDKYTVSTITNGYRVTKSGDTADDPFANFAAEFTLPANNGTTSSSFYNVETNAIAYNSSNQSIATKKIRIKVAVLTSSSPQYDNDASLNGIDLSSGSLTPAFDNSVMLYTVYSNEPTITINLKPRSSKAVLYFDGRSVNDKEIEDYFNNPKKISGPQTYQVEYGTNAYIFSVLSEKYENRQNTVPDATYLYNSWPSNDDADARLIEIVVVRQDTRSTVNTLKSLSISNVDINFKPELKFYTGTVKNEVDSVNISSTLTDGKSKYVNGFGNRTEKLKEGTNTFYVKVQAENGAENVYTITIEREKSANNNLKEIEVNGKIISIQEDKLKYEINVDNEVTTAEVKAIPELEGVGVEISEIPPLVEGNNEITITVTAPNGEKKIYVLNIKRDGLISSNSFLKKLEVKGYDLDFNYHTLEYTLKIGEEQELEIIAEPDHNKAKALITGNKNLVNGSVIKIKVTAEDGSESTYQITIEKEKKKFNFLLLLPIVGGVLLIGGIAFAIVANKKKKKKTVATPLGDLKILSTEEETPSTPVAPTTIEAQPAVSSDAPTQVKESTPEQAPVVTSETASQPAVEQPAPASAAEAAAPAPVVENATESTTSPVQTSETAEQKPTDSVETSENVETLNPDSDLETSEPKNPEIKQN